MSNVSRPTILAGYTELHPLSMANLAERECERCQWIRPNPSGMTAGAGAKVDELQISLNRIHLVEPRMASLAEQSYALAYLWFLPTWLISTNFIFINTGPV